MAFPNSCPALRLRAAAAVVAVWARPGAIRPGRWAAGVVLLRPPASHPCGLCARASLRAALRHRRPIGAPCSRSARAFVARRPAARLVALPSAPPRRCSLPARPAAFAPSMGLPAGFLARVGLLGFVSRSIRSAHSRAGAGILVCVARRPCVSRRSRCSRAVAVGGALSVKLLCHQTACAGAGGGAAG